MKESIRNKLAHTSERYEEVGVLLSQPEVISDQSKFRKLSQEYAEIEPVVQCYREYDKTLRNLEEAKAWMSDADPDLRAMGEEEFGHAQQRRDELETELQKLMLPRDPLDGANVFLEVRAGTGGDEAAIFAGDATHPDNIIFDITPQAGQMPGVSTSGFGHPHCGPGPAAGESALAAGLPATQ